MGRLALPRVELDPLVDLVPTRAVVGHCRLNQAERDSEVLGRGSLIAVVVADDRNDLPDIEARALEPRAAASRTVDEPDQRMLVCSEPFLDVALSERAWRDAAAARLGAEPVERRVRNAETEGLGHVAQCSARHYAQCGNAHSPARGKWKFGGCRSGPRATGISCIRCLRSKGQFRLAQAAGRAVVQVSDTLRNQRHDGAATCLDCHGCHASVNLTRTDTARAGNRRYGRLAVAANSCERSD